MMAVSNLTGRRSARLRLRFTLAIVAACALVGGLLAVTTSSANAADQILVGGSSRNLPLTGTITVGSTITPAVTGAKTASAATAGSAAAATAAPVLANPHGTSSPKGTGVRWALAPAACGVVYTAAGLPAGLSLSADGVITGAATKTGTSTVTINPSGSAAGSQAVTFVWTVT